MSQYSNEKTVQILIALLKAYGIKHIVASPGSANSAFVASCQFDSYFQIFSCVDERSAAYMAVGMAERLGSPVVISCTGATASRNYLPGITEAFYRNIPILSVTSTQVLTKVGNEVSQVIDRSQMPVDTYAFSYELPLFDDQLSRTLEMRVNEGLTRLKELSKPVHFNLETSYEHFNTPSLPAVTHVKRFTHDSLDLLSNKKIAIFAHGLSSVDGYLIGLIEEFCAKYNAVVFADATSMYTGRFSVSTSIIASQPKVSKDLLPDLVIHVEGMSGDYYSMSMLNKAPAIYISNKIKLVDTFGTLAHYYPKGLVNFFEMCNKRLGESNNTSYLNAMRETYEKLMQNIPEVPLSNIFVCKELSKELPSGTIVHLAILNSLRSWNLVSTRKDLTTRSNVGGFGIDGCTSTLIGSALVDESLHVLITGDLAFFYDLNILGNRHLPKNILIILVNNGGGIEFKNYGHRAREFGQKANDYVAALGHFGGNAGDSVTERICGSWGIHYEFCNKKDDYSRKIKEICRKDLNDYEVPRLLEIQTNEDDESKALSMLLTLNTDYRFEAKNQIKKIVGTKIISKLR